MILLTITYYSRHPRPRPRPRHHHHYGLVLLSLPPRLSSLSLRDAVDVDDALLLEEIVRHDAPLHLKEL